MSITTTLQPVRHQYIGGVDKDAFLNVSLGSSNALLNDQNLFRIVNALQQSQEERSASTKYRLHGTINLVSYLANKPTAWTTPEDLIEHNAISTLRTDFELCVGYISSYEPTPSFGSGCYERRMKILATSEQVDLLPCGFSNNIYSEPTFNFMLNGSIDISTLKTTGLGVDWPVTDLLIYLRPREQFRTVNFTSITESTVFHKDTEYGFILGESGGTQNQMIPHLVRHLRPASLSGVTNNNWGTFIYPEVYNLFQLADIRMTAANVERNQAYIRSWADIEQTGIATTGEKKYSDGSISAGYVLFDKETLEIKPIQEAKILLTRTLTQPATTSNQEFLTKLGYRFTVEDTSLKATLDFVYRPIQVIPIKEFSEFIERGNPEDTDGIPENAIETTDGSGDLVWRDILTPGYIEPSSGRGNNSPFVNGCHYIFSNLVYTVGPDMSNFNSFRAFRSTRATLNTQQYRF